MLAIQMATINTAEYFGVSREIGLIAPGRYADILLVGDLEKFTIDLVIASGKVAAQNGKLLIELPSASYPGWVMQSIHLPRPVKASDFTLVAPARPQVTAHVIGIIENQAPNRHLRMQVAVVNGQVKADMERDIAKLAMVERHQSTGNIKLGLVQGFGFNQPCAAATTVAHDSHHMIVVGTDDEDMAKAANTLAECGGGQVVVRKGEVIGKVELPIAGLMSNERAEIVAKKAATVLAGFKACGCQINNPNMTLSLLGLVVIPELRISDLGLIDVNRFDFIPVFE
jgi:adenine deaminase